MLLWRSGPIRTLEDDKSAFRKNVPEIQMT
jgi:hypothetical protein